MRCCKVALLVGALALTGTFPKIAAAELLISEAEGKLPQSAETGMATRGITRGPGVEQVSPASGSHDIKSPVPLKIKFIGRNNVPIDPATVKLTYLKTPAVDLTERVKAHVTKDGIDMPQAEMPPGTHFIRLDVKDAEGRSTSTTISLVVAPK